MADTVDRRLVALVCTLFMTMLGTVYAWSYFQKPLCDSFHWSNSQVAWAFSLAICFLGLAAAAGGVLLGRFGPTRLALWGGLLHGGGYLVAALALRFHSLPLLYLGYGLLGGTGLGLGYVTPVATVARWFPEHKGVATGMVVMGFGFGALFMSKLLAPLLLARSGGDLVIVFATIGLVFLLLAPLLCRWIVFPPVTATLSPVPLTAVECSGPSTLRAALLSRQFLFMWGIFFCNITAGIALIGFQSPLFQEIVRAGNPRLDAATLVGYGSTLIAFSSLCNGLGRFFWGWMSDRIGRRETFIIILATQLTAFLLLIPCRSPWLFSLLVCYVLLCYGGGFGTMPAFILDSFGPRLMPAVYGAVLTAWSAAGLVGPQLVALLKDRYPVELHATRAASLSFTLGGVILGVGLFLCLFVRNGSQREIPS